MRKMRDFAIGLSTSRRTRPHLPDLGLKRREIFIVTERSQSKTPRRAKSRLDGAVMVDIPGDSSRLFTAVD
jgi:hypothetical protein